MLPLDAKKAGKSAITGFEAQDTYKAAFIRYLRRSKSRLFCSTSPAVICDECQTSTEGKLVVWHYSGLILGWESAVLPGRLVANSLWFARETLQAEPLILHASYTCELAQGAIGWTFPIPKVMTFDSRDTNALTLWLNFQKSSLLRPWDRNLELN